MGLKVVNLLNYNTKEVVIGLGILNYIETLYNIYMSLDSKSIGLIVNSSFKKFKISFNYL